MLDYSKLGEALPRVKALLRHYQIKGVAQGVRTKKILFDMYMGTGKTVAALTTLFCLKPEKVLIICSRNSLGTWLDEIDEWFPEFANPAHFNIIRAQGLTVQKRKARWLLKNKVYYLATKETIVRDAAEVLKVGFDAYIIDECHKLPGHKTKTFKALEKILRNIPIKIMLTGTWFEKHPAQGWRHLHLLDRKLFRSYWKFVETYCVSFDGAFGKEIIGPKNIEGFNWMIKEYVYRFHEIDGSVPKSVGKPIWIEMNKQQEKIYNDLSANMYAELENGNLLISQVSLSTFQQHRQLLNCPKILDESLGLGSAFEGILEHLKDNENDPQEQHTVIFSPFRASLPYFEKELQDRGYKTFMFVGGTDGQEVQRMSKAFRALKGQKSVALGTIDFAESFHLGTAIRSHFVGVHWNRTPIKQAEARLARADSDLSQTIVHKYWLYRNSLDLERIHVLRHRTDNLNKTFKSSASIKEFLHVV